MSLRIFPVVLAFFFTLARVKAQSGLQASPALPEKKREPGISISPVNQHTTQKGDRTSFLAPGEDPENRLINPFMKHLALDQKQFWSAPFHIDRRDTGFLLAFAGFTGTLLAGDRWISRQVPGTAAEINRSTKISDYVTYGLIGTAGASYFWGHFIHDDHLRETGFLAGEAALNSTAVAYLFKTITERPRPLADNGNGTFFHGGASFPSEHSAIAWSVASVVAHEYPGTLTEIAAYGLASAVTLTRVTGKQHFPSDVAIGSALGWYFARQVYRAHHDPELGGTGWGSFEKGPGADSRNNDNNGEEKVRNPRHMGSPYVPLDSWVYPAVEKMTGLGYISSAFLGLKPWSRIATAEMVSESGDKLAIDESAPSGIRELEQRLEEEFSYEIGLLDGKSNRMARVESLYTRALSINGPDLNDSYHFGQTVSYDYGRPFERGFNGQVGASLWAAAGPLTIYVRSEFQHAPAAPALTPAELNVIAERDNVPVPAATPIASVNRPLLLEGYVALNLDGWQISAGKQSLDWGPGPGGSFLWSNNIDPIEMVRVVKSDWRLPIVGAVRIDQFFGVLRGHDVIPHPYVYGQKLNFKPWSGLELGFGRTVTIGGMGGNPLTVASFIDSFLGRVSEGSVPGDSHTSMDWVLHIPKVRDYLVFYGELYADDDPIPIVNPPKNPFRPGIYLTRFPGLSKLDLHVEVASTESPGFFNFGGPNRGDLNYWNQLYRDGYTNEGNLIGNTVGRMGRTIEGWLTYWTSTRSTIQFSSKWTSVSGNFIPGGANWQDYQMSFDRYLKSGLYWKNQVQFENISRYPIMFPSSERNLSVIVEFGWTPGHEVKR